MSRLIIGLTGAFGSGTSFLADNFFATKGFEKYSLSQVLKEKYVQEKGEPYKTRHDLQEFGNELRKEDKSALAKTLDEIHIAHSSSDTNIVIDSIRNPAEIKSFSRKISRVYLNWCICGL